MSDRVSLTGGGDATLRGARENAMNDEALAHPGGDAELAFIEDIARRGGALILEGLASGHQQQQEKSSATDISTPTDLAVQKLLVDEIQRRHPLDSVLAEEDVSLQTTSNRRWIIDPLDGTSNFVRGLWPSVVSIALEVDGALECGVVFDPVLDELFSARRQHGAFLNGQRMIRPDGEVSLDRAYVSVGMTGRYSKAPSPGDIIQKLLGPSDSVRDLGASALQLCYVGTGRFDAHIVRAVQRWDVAAGFLVAAEAGCTVEGFEPDSAPTHDAALVTAPRLMKELRAVLGR